MLMFPTLAAANAEIRSWEIKNTTQFPIAAAENGFTAMPTTPSPATATLLLLTLPLTLVLINRSLRVTVSINLVS